MRLMQFKWIGFEEARFALRCLSGLELKLLGLGSRTRPCPCKHIYSLWICREEEVCSHLFFLNNVFHVLGIWFPARNPEFQPAPILHGQTVGQMSSSSVLPTQFLTFLTFQPPNSCAAHNYLPLPSLLWQNSFLSAVQLVLSHLLFLSDLKKYTKHFQKI